MILMSKIRAITGYAVIAVVMIGICYFFVAPIYEKGFSAFRVRRLNLSTAKDYYAILSSWLTFVLGISGLVLGYFYYHDKRNVDINIATIASKRKRLDDLISRIETYDSLVCDVIHHRFSNAKTLKHLRNRISRNFDTIEIMLDINKELLGLDDAEAKIILRVNSFVEKNDVIMHHDHSVLSENSLFSVRDEYVNLMQEAKRICFKKVR